MNHYNFGTLALSKAGHDKNELFIIINEELEYVYLVDGKNRPIENPKRKNKKHIQVINCSEKTLLEKIDANKRITNEDIKRTIKCYKSKCCI